MKQLKLDHDYSQEYNKKPIKKHHYFLGSLLILVCVWITHSSTASIKNDLAIQHKSLLTNTALVNIPTINEQLHFYIDHLGFERHSKPSKLVTHNDTITSLKHTVKKGDILSLIFDDLNFHHLLSIAISKHPVAKQMLDLSIGSDLEFRVSRSNELKQIIYPASDLELLIVDVKGSKIIDARIADLPYLKKQSNVSGTIQSSLYEDAAKIGLSDGMIMHLIKIFEWDIDFALDLRTGDKFNVIYDAYELSENKTVAGKILAAEFIVQGQSYRAIRYTNPKGKAVYYTPEGVSLSGAFLRSPVKFSRISSGFGRRKHPILKRWKAHKGVDYAASIGTAVRSTASGKVVSVLHKRGYGKHIVLRHAGRFTTLYGHLNGYSKGIKAGAKIKQGDIIGYVGKTGLATGAHLHYEFRVNGVHHNSLTYKTPKASSVHKNNLTEFKSLAGNREQQLDKLGITQLAKNANNKSQSTVK